MPEALKTRLQGLRAVHSAKIPYSRQGTYGEADQASGRSMDIRASDEALEEFVHPLVRPHPETGRPAVFSTLGYIVGLEGVAQEEAISLLKEVYDWQTREDVIYRHRWEPGMLTMWDNRSVLHAATGGYDGHDRLLHRTTIGAGPPPTAG